MSLIDEKDMMNIVEKSKSMHGRFMYCNKEKVNSYYICNKHTLFPVKLYEYQVETPLELIQQLKKMWNYQGYTYMNDYATFLTIAAFKARSEKDEEGEISQYIYEF